MRRFARSLRFVCLAAALVALLVVVLPHGNEEPLRASTSEALAAFASSVAPLDLDGRTESRTSDARTTGTVAVLEVSDAWPDIPADLQRAIEEKLRVASRRAVALDLGRGPTAAESAPAASSGVTLGETHLASFQRSDVQPCLSPGASLDSLRPNVRDALRQAVAHLSQTASAPSLNHPVVFGTRTATAAEVGVDDEDDQDYVTAVATAYPVNCREDEWAVALDQASDYDACMIRPGPAWRRNMEGNRGGGSPSGNAAQTRSFAAVFVHELFHCLQFQREGFRSSQLPRWIVEGPAAWAELEFYPASAPGLSSYVSFLQQPRHVHDREHDGVGLYIAFERAGMDVWRDAFRQIAFVANSGRGASRDDKTALGVRYLLDAAQGSGFASTFASSVAREPDWGEDWSLGDHPVDRQLGDTRRSAAVELSLGSSTRLRVTRIGDPHLYVYETIPESAAVIRFQSFEDTDAGAVRVNDRSRRFRGHETIDFCVASPCRCPGGAPFRGGAEDAASPTPERAVSVALTRWPMAHGNDVPPRLLSLDRQQADDALCSASTACTVGDRVVRRDSGVVASFTVPASLRPLRRYWFDADSDDSCNFNGGPFERQGAVNVSGSVLGSFGWTTRPIREWLDAVEKANGCHTGPADCVVLTPALQSGGEGIVIAVSWLERCRASSLDAGKIRHRGTSFEIAAGFPIPEERELPEARRSRRLTVSMNVGISHGQTTKCRRKGDEDRPPVVDLDRARSAQWRAAVMDLLRSITVEDE